MISKIFFEKKKILLFIIFKFQRFSFENSYHQRMIMGLMFTKNVRSFGKKNKSLNTEFKKKKHDRKLFEKHIVFKEFLKKNVEKSTIFFQKG